MKTSIIQTDWLRLPFEIRQQLVLKFAIHKSEGTRVVNQIMVSDGCSQEDLINGLTIGKMIEMLGDEWEKKPNKELFDYLLDKVINKLSNNEQTKVKDIEQTDETPVQVSKRGRPAKGIGK
jgi:Zn-dependent M16 (insulinase) family peptidase